MLLGLTIFGFTYALIVGRRLRWLPLDRPAGAMTGAVLFVACGVLTPRQALGAINGETLALLFGLMGVGAFLAEDSLLDRLADALVARARTPARLLGALVWGAGALSAVITNDAVCVLAAPLVVAWIRRHDLPPLPFLLALATGANTGSVATVVGNPQNMLCATLGGLGYRAYFLHMLPVALVGLALNHALLVLMFRRALAGARLTPPGAPPGPLLDRRSGWTLTVIALAVAAYFAGADLTWTAVAALTILLITHRADPARMWPRIDWAVLVFFAGLFVAVEGFVASGAAAWILARVPFWHGDGGLVSYLGLSAYFLVGSNLVSNVPFILVVKEQMASLPNPTLAWELLAMASTLAGNLTLLGSVANIIVAERGGAAGGMGFWAHLRAGFPLALVTTLLGTLWLVTLHGI